MSTIKIGLLGGSFDPPHLGHLYVANEAKKRLGLGQVWLLPTKQNPLKKETLASFEDRVELCRELIKDAPGVLVKDEEKNLKSNYSIDLVRKIVKKYPNYQFFWIMGADSLINFHLWKNWREIIKLTPLIIIDREDNFYLAKKSKAWIFASKIQRASFLKIKKMNISSTKIRNKNV